MHACISIVLPLAPSTETTTRQERKRSTLKGGKSFVFTAEFLTYSESSVSSFAYIKLHHELLIFRLHSFFHDSVCELLRARRPLSLQNLLHLLLHPSPSCCPCLSSNLHPHLLQPSHAQSASFKELRVD